MHSLPYKVIFGLCRNPDYGKISSATEMLRTMANCLRSLGDASGRTILEASKAKSIGATVALGNQTVVVTYALYRILMTIPGHSIPAVRIRLSKELLDSLQDKVAKKEKNPNKKLKLVEKTIGKDLWGRLAKLKDGEAFEPMNFKHPQPAAVQASPSEA